MEQVIAVLQQILVGINNLGQTPERAYAFQKQSIAAGAVATFDFAFKPAKFAVYVYYQTGALEALYREGVTTNLLPGESDVITFYDGLFLRIPARDMSCSIKNNSGTEFTCIVWALGPQEDVLISAAK